jgi:hypothetical protein
MTTKREQILQAITTRLAAVPGVTSVYRSMTEPMQREDALALCVTWASDRPGAPGSSWHMDRELEVQIGAYARGDIPDKLADPLCESAFSLLMGEPTLGGLAIDIDEGDTSLDLDSADATAGWTTMRFMVRYRTLRSSLTA